MPNRRWAMLAAGLLVCVWFSLLPAVSGAGFSGGTPYSVKVWETEDGLPQNSVIAMTQTRDGYLWVGTRDGLARFDGIRFTSFEEKDMPGLGSSPIISLFEDSRGTLWIGTENAGVALLKDGQVTSLGIGPVGREGRMVSICEDATGAVWLYTADGQLWRYHQGATNNWRFGVDRFSVDRSTMSRAVIAEKSGRVWVGTDGRLSALTPSVPVGVGGPAWETNLPVGKMDFLLASERGGFWLMADHRIQKWTTNGFEPAGWPYPPNCAAVTTACEDREGHLLIGTPGAGVFWFDARGNSTCLSTNEDLSYNFILSLHVDREGSLWVGTDGGGLNRVKRKHFDVLEETRGLVVQSVSENDQGGLWIGSFHSSGAALWSKGVMERFGPSQGLMNSFVRTLFVDRAQRVWVATLGGLYQLQKDHFHRVVGPEPIHRWVHAIHQDRAGRLWLGTQEGLARWDEKEWQVFTTAHGLSADDVQAIAEDTDGSLWIGTKGGGLNRLRDDKFTAFHKKDGLPGEDISSLYVDAEGVVWIGTSGGGLGRWQKGRWTRYSTREGLINNSVGYLVEDDQGFLWIGSNAGLMRVRKKALNDFADGATASFPIRVYGKADGLPSRECTLGVQPGACRARDGKLWFPTIKGLASVDVAQIHPNTNPPPVVIESVLIEGEPQNINGLRPGLLPEVVVPAGKEWLEFQYTSLNLGAAEMARFKYRLEGHETAWFEAAGTRVAHYGKMPLPGRYRFQVTACNEDGVWNETASSIAIVVEPPFWQTWWFRTISAVFVLGWLGAVIYYVSTQRLQRQLASLRQQEALEKERSRIARDIHDQLGASLTQVSLLGELVESDKDSPAEVEAHGRQISQTARDTSRALDQIVWTVNPSNDTLEGLVNYVCKYAQEYLAVAGLRYRLDVPAQLPEAPISPEVRHNVFLAAKEAVTNVVRHAQASSVWLRLKLAPDAFTLEIQDDGRGPAGMDGERAQSRNGLRNMGKRMEDVGGRFAIGPAPEGGTLVRLTAPLAKR